MKTRIPIIWLALLTVFQSYTITDMSSTLREVKACQEESFAYMEKSARILHKIKTGEVTLNAAVGRGDGV